jgi:hypothetical protein
MVHPDLGHFPLCTCMGRRPHLGARLPRPHAEMKVLAHAAAVPELVDRRAESRSRGAPSPAQT